MLPHHQNLLEDTTIITGIGRSGTTFLAHVFHNAGYDLEVHPEDIGTGTQYSDGGMEHSAFFHAGRTLQLPNKMFPRIVKDPTFGVNVDKWLGLGQTPRDVIILARDMDSCTKSSRSLLPEKNITKVQLYDLWHTGLRNIVTRGIPVTIVPYPEIATDRSLSSLLKPWMEDPWPVIQDTYDESMVHY